MSIEQSLPLMDRLVLVVESVVGMMTMASDSCSFPPWIVDAQHQQMAMASSIFAWIDAASDAVVESLVEHCTGLVLGQEVVILWHFPVHVLRWPSPPGS